MKLLYYLRPSTFSIEVLAALLGEGSNISGSNAVSTCTQLTTFRMSDAEDEGRLRLKYDGTSAETRFRLLAKRTSPFKSEGASVQSTAGSRGLRISHRNAAYTMFRGSVKNTGYPLLSPVSPSLPPMHYSVPSYFNWSLLQFFETSEPIYRQHGVTAQNTCHCYFD